MWSKRLVLTTSEWRQRKVDGWHWGAFGQAGRQAGGRLAGKLETSATTSLNVLPPERAGATSHRPQAIPSAAQPCAPAAQAAAAARMLGLGAKLHQRRGVLRRHRVLELRVLPVSAGSEGGCW